MIVLKLQPNLGFRNRAAMIFLTKLAAIQQYYKQQDGMDDCVESTAKFEVS